MADFNITPIGNTGKPVLGMSLSDMMSVAGAAQAYKQAQQINPLQLQASQQQVEQARQMNPMLLQAQQQTTRTGQIALGVEEQKNQERLLAQDFFSKPDNFQTNGRIDLDKINKVVPTIAPLTGQDYITKFTQLGEAQTKAISAKQNLTQDQRRLIGSRFAVMGRMGVQDKDAYLKEMDLLKEENPDNIDLHNLIDAYKTTWGAIPSGPHLPDLAIRGAQTLLSPSEQQTAFAPASGTISTGANILQAVTTPGVGAQPPRVQVGTQPLANVEVGPTSRMVATGRTDMNNQPTAYVYSQDGRLLGEVTIPSGVSEPQMPGGSAARPVPPAARPAAPVPAVSMTNAPTRLQAGETASTYDAAQKIRTDASDAAKQVPIQLFNSNQIIKLADEVAAGKGADFLGNLSGGYAALPFTLGNNTENLQKLGHYMSMQTASLAQSSGLGGTDAGRNLAGQMAGTTEWSAPAIKDTARVNRALTTATQLFSQGIEAAFTKSNNNPFSARNFQNSWVKTLGANGIDAIRLHDAFINSDVEGAKNLVKSLGGTESKRYKDALSKIGEMNLLLKGAP